MKSDEHRLDRTSSNCRSTRRILPSSCTTTTTTTPNSISSSTIFVKQDHNSGGDEFANDHRRPPVTKTSTLLHLSSLNKPRNISTVLRSVLAAISVPACRWLALPSKFNSSSTALGRVVTGTLFGSKKGHVSFAVQEDPRSDPVLLLELATPTCTLVKEMASGLVRIALECKNGSGGSNGSSTRPVKLFQEPMWTMHCNGKKCGYAMSRTCEECDWHVMSTVQTVSVGAGVIPVDKNRVGFGHDGGGEVMYMRARFERVVGSRDSEAFYMMNPDGTGGPELSIFLLRI
ncbi:hypothetical protein Sjap_002309 [Stephania japonica]|uniref:Protein MIZU-KUSSEI 1 n=1 Tax=Stephania japonica TaxID=461633 RepID=A0AAP0KNZ6_9MAGN